MTDLDPLNEYLDGDASDSDELDLSGITREEIAKHLLVAGVTTHLLSKSRAATDETVRTNMVAVREDKRQTRNRRIRRGLFAGFAAATAVVITTLVYVSEPPSLNPLLEKVHHFVHDELDREYAVRTESSNLGAAIFADSMRLSLYVRGTDRYAAELQFDILGRQTFSVWMGSNGTEHWLVPPDIEFLKLPVIVSDESLNSSWQAGQLGMVEEFASRMVRAENMMTVFALLADLDTDYKIEAARESVQSALPAGQVEVVAYRRPQADITIPDLIRLVVDENTGVVRRIALKFADLPSSMGIANPFKWIRYELKNETANRDGVYEHDSHHDPDREVIVR